MMMTLDTTSKAWSVKEIIDFINMKMFRSLKYNVGGWEDQPQSKRKHLQNIHLIQDCSPKHTKKKKKKLVKFKNKKRDYLIKKRTPDLNGHLRREAVKMKSKQMNRSFTSFIIREMHIKRITRCHYTPVRAQIQTTDNVVRMGSKVNSHSLLVGTQKRYRQTRWGTVLRFPTKVNILLLHTAIAVLDIYPEHLKTKVHTKTCATTL